VTTALAQKLEALRARFIDAQLRGDRREALRVVEDGLACGASVTDLHEQVLEAAQREIGRLWQENLVTVAQEHMATAIANLVLTQLFERAQPAQRNDKRILVACVEGELHEFPARLVADALDLAGFSVRYLGANVPTDSLLAMIAANKPDMVALSATMSFHSTALREAVTRIRAEHGPSLPIAVGGAALAWAAGLAEDLGVEVTGATASDLVVAATRVLGVAR
jgi:methanogenic corrinoid protein MtbC1